MYTMSGRVLPVLAVLSLAASAAVIAQPSRSAADANAAAAVHAMQNDDLLLERVANALANDPELADVDITVFVGEGRVALEGETRTAGQAVRAVAVTRRVAGDNVEVRSDLRAHQPHDAADA
jgi:osmotically-inducible protein OsmY